VAGRRNVPWVSRVDARVKIGALSVALAIGMSLATASAATAVAITTRVSLQLDGSQRDHLSYDAAISADGALIAYETVRTVVYSDDGYGTAIDEVYAYDRTTGATEWISRGPLGLHGDGSSENVAVSADGRYVAFDSSSSDLVPGDDNGRSDIFVRDRQTGALERIADPRPGGSTCFLPALSRTGRYVAFDCYEPQRARKDVLLYDRGTGRTEVVGPTEWRNYFEPPAVSGGGRFVAFNSGSSIAVRDRALHKTEQISRPGSLQSGPAISASGRFVAFDADTKRYPDEEFTLPDHVYVRDRETGRTELVSVATNGQRANHFSGGPSISPNGRYVSFASDATNLVPHDTNNVIDVFVRDRQAGTTRRVSISSARTQSNSVSADYESRQGLQGFARSPISARGRFVAFASDADNLVASDTNRLPDVFLRGPLTP
jgi:Tol biopolymer transport system component